jgi:hypothetical protein
LHWLLCHWLLLHWLLCHWLLLIRLLRLHWQLLAFACGFNCKPTYWTLPLDVALLRQRFAFRRRRHCTSGAGHDQKSKAKRTVH